DLGGVEVAAEVGPGRAAVVRVVPARVAGRDRVALPAAPDRLAGRAPAVALVPVAGQVVHADRARRVVAAAAAAAGAGDLADDADHAAVVDRLAAREAAAEVEGDERALAVAAAVGAGEHPRALAAGVAGVGTRGGTEDHGVVRGGDVRRAGEGNRC